MQARSFDTVPAASESKGSLSPTGNMIHDPSYKRVSFSYHKRSTGLNGLMSISTSATVCIPSATIKDDATF